MEAGLLDTRFLLRAQVLINILENFLGTPDPIFTHGSGYTVSTVEVLCPARPSAFSGESTVSTRADGGCIPLLASLCDRKTTTASQGHSNNTDLQPQSTARELLKT